MSILKFSNSSLKLNYVRIILMFFIQFDEFKDNSNNY